MVGWVGGGGSGEGSGTDWAIVSRHLAVRAAPVKREPGGGRVARHNGCFLLPAAQRFVQHPDSQCANYDVFGWDIWGGGVL